ncbi:uncharacterized protein UBRO_20788 [Ustilago bromivora]|uniref:Pericentrin/AKAP-450 centrosomal targeting domain-containing protein n=1 Tax=Ustilago bromivora TaxID=307758 RepID=A0A1K0G7T9_9BASI|nr:uncharacterized protein UBRO_20788 [Ustilago bromivora]
MVQVRSLVDQLKSKTQEVDRIKTKLDELERSRTSSAPPPYAEEPSLIAARKMHQAECKGLILQIKYLKLKLNREMDLRADLTHQKQYISLLLQGLARSDAELGRLIFDLDLQHHARDTRRRQSDAKRKWKKVLNAATAVARMQLLAKKAEEVVDIKQSLQKAHKEVKSRRNVLPLQDQKAGTATAADLVGFKAGFASRK